MIDPSGGLTREDYLALRHRTPDAPETEAKNPPPIPDLPSDENGDEITASLDKLVSINVTDNVPVRDVLMELVRKTNTNLELDPACKAALFYPSMNNLLGKCSNASSPSPICALISWHICTINQTVTR